MFPFPPPPFYDDLTGSLEHALALFARGVADRRSPFHTPVVATIGADGAPQARAMVLRAVDAPARTLRFHTDARSVKAAEIAAEPRIAIHVYDQKTKIQVRVAARARFEPSESALAQEAWAASRPQSRLCYAQAPAPASALAAPGEAGPGASDGAENFAVLVACAHEIEWLYLRHAGHRRARFAWDGAQWIGTWLAP